ncbi:MAG: hypothetical protein L6461_08005 [Anaerolineae bacterium]|nr:hypothetical protein [Anaerolineae bacterium]
MSQSVLDGQAISLNLSGIAGGAWTIGHGEPQAELGMDVLDFNIFVSGRFSFHEAMQRAKISGDKDLIVSAFKNLLILY